MTMNKTSSLPVNSNGNNTINNNSNMHIRLANLKDQKNLLDKCIHELELEIIEIDSGGRDNSLKHIVEIEPVQEQYRKICSIYCKFQSAPKILAVGGNPSMQQMKTENVNELSTNGKLTGNVNFVNSATAVQVPATTTSLAEGTSSSVSANTQDKGTEGSNGKVTSKENQSACVNTSASTNGNDNPATNTVANINNLSTPVATENSSSSSIVNNTPSTPNPTPVATRSTPSSSADVASIANDKSASDSSSGNPIPAVSTVPTPPVTRRSAEASTVSATTIANSPAPPITRQTKSSANASAVAPAASASLQSSIANSKPKRKAQEMSPAPAMEVRRSTRTK